MVSLDYIWVVCIWQKYPSSDVFSSLCILSGGAWCQSLPLLIILTLLLLLSWFPFSKAITFSFDISKCLWGDTLGLYKYPTIHHIFPYWFQHPLMVLSWIFTMIVSKWWFSNSISSTCPTWHLTIRKIIYINNFKSNPISQLSHILYV